MLYTFISSHKAPWAVIRMITGTSQKRLPAQLVRAWYLLLEKRPMNGKCDFSLHFPGRKNSSNYHFHPRDNLTSYIENYCQTSFILQVIGPNGKIIYLVQVNF